MLFAGSDGLIHLQVKYKEPDVIPGVINNELNHVIPEEPNIKLTPRQYQIDAYNALKNLKRAILQLICGMGKTFISIMLARHYDNIIILSPLKAFAQQTLNRYKLELTDRNFILIDSEGERDVDKIILREKNIISATFKSADVVLKLIDKLKNVYVIVDEFHNLSPSNLSCKDNHLYQILTKEEPNFLFMSATPKIYDDGSTENNFDKILGKIEYSYSFADALKNHYINDYIFIIPGDKNTYDRHEYLYHNMIYYGYKRCIMYVENIDQVDLAIQKFTEINQTQYKIDMNIKAISNKTRQNERNEIIDIFKKSDTLSIIVSVRILDECIDIAQCDSVYLSYECKSKIRTIQRICRCLRIDPNKMNRSGIFLFFDNEADIKNYLEEIADNKIQLKIEKRNGLHEREENFKAIEPLPNLVCEQDINNTGDVKIVKNTVVPTVIFISKNYSEGPSIHKFSSFKELPDDKLSTGELVLNYYRTNEIVKWIGDIIIQEYSRNDNPSQQTVWCTYTSSLTFILREMINQNLTWSIDKDGIKTSEYIIRPILQHIIKPSSCYVLDLALRSGDILFDTEFYKSQLKNVGSLIHIIYNGDLNKKILKYISVSFYLDRNKLHLLKINDSLDVNDELE